MGTRGTEHQACCMHLQRLGGTSGEERANPTAPSPSPERRTRGSQLEQPGERQRGVSGCAQTLARSSATLGALSSSLS